MWSSRQKSFPSSSQDNQQASPGPNKKLRSACNRCHQAKTKCSGGMPCASCAASKEPCQYSLSTRTGRPKGARNKRNHEQMNAELQTEGNPAPEKPAPVETNEAALEPQYSWSRPLTPPHTSMDHSLMQFDDILGGGPSGKGYAQDTAFHVNAHALCDLLDYNGGQDVQRNESVVTKNPNEGPKPSPFTAISTISAHDMQSLFGDRSSYASSPRNFSDDRDLMPEKAITSSLFDGAPSAENDDFFAYPQLFTPPMSSMPSSTSSTSHTRGTEQRITCDCLEQQTALLCRLKNLTKSHGVQSVDAILTGTQQALAPWQSLIQCRICPHEDDLSVLLLAVMSIRSIVRRLEALCIGSASASSGYSTPILPAPTVSEVGPGTYEPTQHEQKHITDLLIIHAVGKIKFALLSLKEKFAQSRGQKASNNMPNVRSTEEGSQQVLTDSNMDVECFQNLVENLESTIQAVVSAVRTHSVTLDTCGGGIEGVS